MAINTKELVIITGDLPYWFVSWFTGTTDIKDNVKTEASPQAAGTWTQLPVWLVDYFASETYQDVIDYIENNNLTVSG